MSCSNLQNYPFPKWRLKAMGIIDSTTFKFNCPRCNASENSTVREYGSQYGGSWGTPSAVSKFKVEWDGGTKIGGPQPKSALCAACNTAATVDIS